MLPKAAFIASDQYRTHSYGDMHPLGIPRVSLTVDLIKASQAISPKEFIESPQASEEQLGWFHTEKYIKAMQVSEAQGKVMPEFRKEHNLGNFENPYFPNFYTTPATATGGSIHAAEMALKGINAFSPAGGMHHATPNQAHGFCFFNDPVLAIMRLLQAGKRVLYVDIDAHHGDGVERAFISDESVATLSIHMDTAYAYPFKGGDISQSGDHANVFNMPLPKACNDAEYGYVFDTLWPAVFERVSPDVIVLQAGTDILLPDPLGKFHISTQQFLQVVAQIKQSVNPGGLVVLGGGGYHPLSLARCWLGVWGILSEREIPERLSEPAKKLLRAVDWDMDEDEDYFSRLFESRFDPPQNAPIRAEIKDRVNQLLSSHPALNIKQREVYYV